MSTDQTHIQQMSKQLSKEKRTQAERRAETRELLMSSACSLFGERGYDATTLEDIAEDCRLTIRPIYYHFGSKRGLFLAVNGLMEQRALQAMTCSSAVDAWESLLALCTNPAFRLIILEDAPNVLGRDRWTTAQRLPYSSSLAVNESQKIATRNPPGAMCDRVVLAILIETAMAVLVSGDEPAARSEAIKMISRLLPTRNAATAPGWQSRRPLRRRRMPAATD